jgi:hypothetical protein
MQSCPCFDLQSPLASHDLVSRQLSSSSAPVTGTHSPPPPMQASHAPHESIMQQRPSTQLPVEQSLAVMQLLPGLALQAPWALQVLSPKQVSSSLLSTLTQVPCAPVHAWQEPQAGTEQQRPSMQLPDTQWASLPQAAPAGILFSHAPAALQYCDGPHGVPPESQPLAQ